MPTSQKPITSARLELRLSSVTHSIGSDREHLVFPALAGGGKDEAPTQNLNTAAGGPAVVCVDVHPVPERVDRGGSLGHSGLERLSLFLTPKRFEQWVALAATLPHPPLSLIVDVDAEGNITRASLNGDELDAEPTADALDTSDLYTGTD